MIFCFSSARSVSPATGSASVVMPVYGSGAFCWSLCWFCWIVRVRSSCNLLLSRSLLDQSLFLLAQGNIAHDTMSAIRDTQGIIEDRRSNGVIDGYYLSSIFDRITRKDVTRSIHSLHSTCVVTLMTFPSGAGSDCDYNCDVVMVVVDPKRSKEIQIQRFDLVQERSYLEIGTYF